MQVKFLVQRILGSKLYSEGMQYMGSETKTMRLNSNMVGVRLLESLNLFWIQIAKATNVLEDCS